LLLEGAAMRLWWVSVLLGCHRAPVAGQQGGGDWQKLETEPYPGKQDDIYFLTSSRP
jgi:hypothetical protein